MSASSDRDLIQHARRGHTEAFGELVLRYQTSVFNVCYRILHERAEAEDMTQETFLRARARLQTFDDERNFGPWIRRVAANVCLNHLQSQKSTAPLGEERDSGESTRPEAQVEVRERSEQIRSALASLPVHYRVVIELRHYQELSYDEIAAELQIPLSDVRSHLFRARKILAEKLHASGSLGIDHGHGSMMMVLGGNVRGGQVHGEWPGMREGQLIGPGDLAVTTDYRDVLSEILVKRLHNTATREIFPEYEPKTLSIMK